MMCKETLIKSILTVWGVECVLVCAVVFLAMGIRAHLLLYQVTAIFSFGAYQLKTCKCEAQKK